MRYDVAVIGLGYVGLTFATALAELGFSVLGVERRADIVQMTRKGVPHFSERGLRESLKHTIESGKLSATANLSSEDSAGIYIITVGTPLNNQGQFNVSYIAEAAREVSDNMRGDALVILRSTVALGTSRDIVAPILGNSRKDFEIAMCPERTLEGKAMEELRCLPQIIGADEDETRQRCAQFFNQLTPTVVQVSSLETAEIIKLVDNTFRDVQFGFANEVARVCDSYGVNAMEVVKGGKLGYPRTNLPLPGLVGGPCLEKDPHILAQSLERRGVTPEITKAARHVNERQPDETVGFVSAQLAKRFPGQSPKIAIAGIAFKGVPATDDLRGSMALRVISSIRKHMPGAQLRVFDPVCTETQLRGCDIKVEIYAETVEEAIDGVHCLIIANNHPELGQIPPVELTSLMVPRGFIYDYWNHFSDHRRHDVGDAYYGVGNIGLVR